MSSSSYIRPTTSPPTNCYSCKPFAKPNSPPLNASRQPSLRIAIIQGSARKDGDTSALVEAARERSGWDVIDLNDYNFSYYDYEHRNRGDDFLPLIQRLITDYDVWVFATPVYWYSMSGLMKVFFDRISDLLTIEKDWGRKIRGKYLAVLSCSAGENLGDYFWLPFRRSAEYLGMTYLGGLHTELESGRLTSGDRSRLRQFVGQIGRSEVWVEN